MPPELITLDIQGILAHAEQFGVLGLSRLQRAMLSGIVHAYMNIYTLWHWRVWG